MLSFVERAAFWLVLLTTLAPAYVGAASAKYLCASLSPNDCSTEIFAVNANNTAATTTARTASRARILPPHNNRGDGDDGSVVVPAAAATTATTCGEYIAAHLNACSDSGGGIVELKAGVFELIDPSAPPLAPLVSLSNLKNVELRGATHASNGSAATTLRLHGIPSAFSLSDSTNVTFSNLAVDMARLPYTYGKCVAAGPDHFTVSYDPNIYPFPQQGAASSLNFNGNEVDAEWLSRVQAVLEFDPKTWRCAEAGIDVYSPSPDKPFAGSWNSGRSSNVSTYTLQGVGTSNSARIAPGAYFVLRHQVYGGNAFSVSRSSDISWENVDLYAVPGMGFYAGDSNNLTLQSCGVRRRPGLPMSITADASHFSQCGGTIVLQDTHFEGQGDDGINVHGVFHDVRDLHPNNTAPSATAAITASSSKDNADYRAHPASSFPSALDSPALTTFVLGSRPAGGLSPLSVGQVYVFRNRSTWALEGEAVLTAAGPVSGTNNPHQQQWAQFNFSGNNKAAATNISRFALLENAERRPAVHISNSYFGQNRARGALLKTSNVLVSNCTFDHNSGPCVQAFPDGCYWFESGGFSNWTLTNSTFWGCNGGAAAGLGDVFVAACAPKWRSDGLPLPSGEPVTAGQPFADISVTDSRFVQYAPHRALAIWGSNGVTLSGNRIEMIVVANNTGIAHEAVHNSSSRSSSNIGGGGGGGGGDFGIFGDIKNSRTRNHNFAAVTNRIFGSLDGFSVDATGASIWGWAVDPARPSDNVSSVVRVLFDDTVVLEALANDPRPDLVPVVTKSPYHGYNLRLPDETSKALRHGNHTLSVVALGAGSSSGSISAPLKGGPVCVNAFRRRCAFPQDCHCGAPLPPFILLSNSLACQTRENSCPVLGPNGTLSSHPCNISLEAGTLCHNDGDDVKQAQEGSKPRHLQRASIIEPKRKGEGEMKAAAESAPMSWTSSGSFDYQHHHHADHHHHHHNTQAFKHDQHLPQELRHAAAFATASDEEEEQKEDSGSLPWIRASNSDAYFYDEHGRVRIFHGGNRVQKAWPWYFVDQTNNNQTSSLTSPTGVTTDADTEFALMQKLGFNVMRLGWMWSGYNPSPGEFNATYATIVKGIVSRAAAHGIYVLLDMHQDVLSSRFCLYDGVPLWVINKSVAKHAFPWPLTGNCSSRGWEANILTEAAAQAYQDLYDNHNGMRDDMAAFWAASARVFRNTSSIIGYELINEPFAGNVYADPTLFLPGVAGAKNLQRLYDALSEAIRKLDSRHILFYEPVTWGMIFNGSITGTGLDHVPGGRAYRNVSALSFHYYCDSFVSDYAGHPVLRRLLCDATVGPLVMRAVQQDLQRLGGSAMMTEGMACDAESNSSEPECARVMALLDDSLFSWTDYGDSQGATWLPSQAQQISWARTYAQAVQGTPTLMRFDNTTRDFQFCFAAAPEVDAVTEIFASTSYSYPSGRNVSTTPNLDLAWEHGDIVGLRLRSGVIKGDRACVEIRRSSSGSSTVAAVL